MSVYGFAVLLTEIASPNSMISLWEQSLAMRLDSNHISRVETSFGPNHTPTQLLSNSDSAKTVG